MSGAVCGSRTALASAAQGSGNGFSGEVNVKSYASGGNGGSGAIILEYADPKKKD